MNCPIARHSITHIPQTGDTDPITIWKVLPSENPLVRLAILLLSFVPNSASTERLFTKMGDIKTKKRNRMLTKKLRDVAFVKSELRREQAALETARKRLKRRFGNKATNANEDASENAEKSTGSGRVEDEEVVRAAEDSEAESSDAESESEAESEADTVANGNGNERRDEMMEHRSSSFTALALNLVAAAAADEDGDDVGQLIPASVKTGQRVRTHASSL